MNKLVMENNETWTYEIKAKESIFNLNLREVWHYRDLLLMFVKRDFITFYKQTILGPLWFFFQPILTTLIYLILFGQIAGLSTDGAPQFVFYLCGITVWNYFSEGLTKTSTVFKDNASVFGKVYFPRLIMPMSIVVSALMKFAIQFGFFVLVVCYQAFVKETIHPNAWVLATPFLLLLMLSYSLGLGMIFSSLTVKYKDLVFLLTFGIQLYMYASPVVYPLSAIPEKYAWVVKFNPLNGILECFRYGFLGVGSFDPFSLVYSALTIFCILILGTVIFNKVERSFMDSI
jgi:lipopolysaccharide transport system permease protein